MDTRNGSSTSRNEEICGNTANAYGTSIRRGSDDVPHNLDREHKFSFVCKKGRRTVSYLLGGYEGRVAKWAIELGEHDIVFQERGDETPKDFLIEVPLEDNKKEAEEKADTKPKKTELSCEWKLFTDGAASSDSSSAGLMLIDPEGKEYTYALRFRFETTNNEAEYEALLVGLRIA
ncbi:reverse transcriptase domain-containing protein [Tanacetum coccineum]